jgi:phosphoribosylanthranilate isomerase
MVDVKICGLTSAEAVATAAQGGARYLGFVFFPKSPRNIAPDRAAGLAGPIRRRVDIVAVVVNPDETLLEAIARTLQPDWIQLHGDESPARTAAARRFAAKGVIKALPVARSEDLAGMDAFTEAADMLLFDAKAPPGAVLPGGNGAAFDWKILRVRKFPKPWILSGGLSPENVREAVSTSEAAAVDVSSGVESAPGVKDPTRIERFLAEARASRAL